jgi:hypothetical protein
MGRRGNTIVPDRATSLRTGVLSIGVFFVAACAWSWFAARWLVLTIPVGGTTLRIDDSMAVGFGPAIGALVASVAFGWSRQPSLRFASRPAIVIAALAIIVLTTAVLGLARAHLGPHLDGLSFALTVIVYCFGEELGWRGWLNDQLAGLPAWQAAAITAPLWYAWHWTFLGDLYASASFAAGFGAAIALASFGLATAARRTGGYGIAVVWHAAVKLFLQPASIPILLATAAAATFWVGRASKPGPDDGASGEQAVEPAPPVLSG